MPVLLVKMLLAALKPHMWCAIGLFLLVASMVVQPSQDDRAMTLAPITILFVGFISFYGLEYDAFVKIMQRIPRGSEIILLPLKAPRIELSAPRVPRPARPSL